MKITIKIDEAPVTHFLADKTGRVVFEVNNNLKADIINLTQFDRMRKNDIKHLILDRK